MNRVLRSEPKQEVLRNRFEKIVLWGASFVLIYHVSLGCSTVCFIHACIDYCGNSFTYF